MNERVESRFFFPYHAIHIEILISYRRVYLGDESLTNIDRARRLAGRKSDWIL